jgi:nitroreductase
MNTLEAIRTRRSTRCYQQKPVEADKVEQLILAANNAPKAGTIHISAVENKEALKSLNSAAKEAMLNSGNEFLVGRASLDGYEPLYGAPLLFMISAPQGAPYNVANASCAAANITIAATDLGLGSCYVISPILGAKAKPELTAQMGVPENFEIVCGVLVGYAAGDAFATPKSTVDNVNYCK